MKNSPKETLPIADFEVKAILGSTMISYEEFVNLQIDDLLILDQGIESSITVRIDNQAKYKGIPGTYEKKRAIKLK